MRLSIYNYASQLCVMDELTTVRITKRTREKLAELGSKKETYEDIIQRLIEFYKKNSDARRAR